jgi:anti-sigma regulatory factor (Ser/Thr protein kinase)
MRLAGTPTSIARARDEARRFAMGCGAAPDDVALAASEAVTNAIVHGYRDGGGGSIELRGYSDGDDCVLEVIDYGVGMRPHPENNGLGLGLPVISAIAGRVEILNLDRGTAVRMRFPRA